MVLRQVHRWLCGEHNVTVSGRIVCLQRLRRHKSLDSCFGNVRRGVDLQADALTLGVFHATEWASCVQYKVRLIWAVRCGEAEHVPPRYASPCHLGYPHHSLNASFPPEWR